MEIGQILKEAREEKSLTLDDIQEMTKIQKRYLVAIEQNEFQALPGRFYARAFIKEYAEVIGLNATELLAEFDEEKIETEDITETAQYSRLERTKAPKEAKSTSFLSIIPTIIVVILIIAIVVVAWMFLQKSSNDSENEAVQNNNEIIRDVNEGKQTENENDNETETNENDAKNESDEEEEKETGSFEVDEIGEESSPLSTMSFTYSGEKVEVELEVEQDTYLEIRGASDEVYYADTLMADADVDTFDVTDEDRVYFNIGNTAGLTVYINGVEMEYPVDRNEKVHQKIWVNLVKN
ncbi:helix-turn-helix domain-containing protein [Pseudogracilibacillus sp. ICA-222130]|uniref:helix-turn-helix domain-containing protein n=1 Tax=Pseudogracilibacillus sp. ICA-222130 TaxID=3134655 RepID=UPI0030BD6609